MTMTSWYGTLYALLALYDGGPLGQIPLSHKRSLMRKVLPWRHVCGAPDRRYSLSYLRFSKRWGLTHLLPVEEVNLRCYKPRMLCWINIHLTDEFRHHTAHVTSLWYSSSLPWWLRDVWGELSQGRDNRRQESGWRRRQVWSDGR